MAARAGDCTRTIVLSDGTNLAYKTRDDGVSYTITDYNSSGTEGKVFCYSSAQGGQVEETGSGYGADVCKK